MMDICKEKTNTGFSSKGYLQNLKWLNSVASFKQSLTNDIKSSTDHTIGEVMKPSINDFSTKLKVSNDKTVNSGLKRKREEAMKGEDYNTHKVRHRKICKPKVHIDSATTKYFTGPIIVDIKQHYNQLDDKNDYFDVSNLTMEIGNISNDKQLDTTNISSLVTQIENFDVKDKVNKHIVTKICGI